MSKCLGEAWYEALAEDASGNQYKVFWLYEPDDDDDVSADDSNNADWLSPYCIVTMDDDGPSRDVTVLVDVVDDFN